MLASALLSDEQLASYRDRGYVVVREVLTPDLLAEVRRVVDEFIDQARGLTESNDVLDLEPAHRPDDPQVRRIRSPIRLHDVFREIALRGKVPAIVAELIGPNVKFHHNKVNVKVGKVGSEAKWHQDYPFTPHTNHDFVAAAIALDDCTVENGCVYAIPGSHHGRAYSHYDDDTFVGCITEEIEPSLLATAEPMELRAGDMSIHHCLTVHGSAPNASARRRRLLINQYAAADAFALSKNTSGTEYDGHIVAGEASRYARLEAGRVLMPPMHTTYRSVFALQQARTLREF